LLQLEDVIPLFIVLILSLSFHEAAHAWTADRLGDPTARMQGRLTLNPLSHIDWIGTVLFPLVALYTGAPLIGWAKPVPVNTQNLRSPRQGFALVAAAGPISNLILAVWAAAALVIFENFQQEPSLFISLLTRTVFLNVLLAVFNLIPVPPLDGGNIIAGFVPEGVARAIDGLRPYGMIVLYALMLTGALGTIAWPIQSAILRWLLP
jgi:Zn-dependent protease